MKTKNKYFLIWFLMLSFVVMPNVSWANSGPLGHWYGFIEWPGYGKCHVAIVVEESGNGNLEGWYDNIEGGNLRQPFKTLKLSEKAFHGETVHGEVMDLTLTGMDSLKGTFVGILKMAPTLIWKTCPIELKRGENFSLPRVDSKDKAVTDYSYIVPKREMDGWETANIQSVGGDRRIVEAGIKKVLDLSYPNIHSLVVVRHGRLVIDEYFYGYSPGDEHPLASCTKSVLSTLFGIAQGQGLLNTSQKLYELFPGYETKKGWDPRKKNITLGTVLSMSAGFACDDLNDSVGSEANCSQDMEQSPDWLDFSLSQSLDHDPGSHFNYCSSCLIPLGALVARQSGMLIPDFAQKYLYDPLGIKAHHWSSGPNGITTVASGHWMRPRDMAKLGLLYLNDGKWKGIQILPPNWVAEATTPKPALDGIRPRGERPDYGYLWWCAKIHTDHGDIPAFHAAGKGGQLIIVVPKLDLVCVITAGNNNETGHEVPEMDLFMKYIYSSFS